MPTMKKNLRSSVECDTLYRTSDGVSEIRVKHVVFYHAGKWERSVVRSPFSFTDIRDH